MSGYGSGDRPGDEDPWRPPPDAGPGQPQKPEQPEYGQPQYGQHPSQYGELPPPPPQQEPSTPQYPQYPSTPPYGYSYPGGTQPAGPARPPSTVRWASIAIIVSSALGILGVIVNIVRLDSLVDEIVRESTTTVERDAARAGVLTFMVIEFLVSMLFILLALQIRRGKNWARIVVLVIAGIVILLNFLALGSSGGSGLLGILGLGLLIVTVGLLLNRSSNEYFRAASRPR